MSNSPLVNHVRISPHSNPRNHKIDTITIHHMAGDLTVESCGAGFADPAREGSSNYGVDNRGRVGMYVEENRRAWTSSNRDNDHRAVTIEVANDSRGPDWHVSDVALEKTIDLCVDICQRNGIARLNYTGDTSGNLTMHKWFTPTVCPGPYLESKFPYIAEQVNARLGAQSPQETPAPVKPSANTWRVQTGAYGSAAAAERQKKQLAAAGFDAYVVVVDGTLWRVQVGECTERADAEKLHAELKNAGYVGMITTLSGSPAPSVEPETLAPSTSENGEVVEMKIPVLKNGSTGSAVAALQALLIGYKYDVGKTGADGSFGPATETAVRKYQSRNGLAVDGSVGPATWRKLLGV